MNPNPRDKGKRKANEPRTVQPYKSAIQKTPEQLKTEALEKTPDELKLREDAYSIALKTNNTNEYIYPYIPLSTEWLVPIEHKYAHLSPYEIAAFYLKDNADPYYYPKTYLIYFAILETTGSVEFDSTVRSGKEWAYSKAYIRKVITPEAWQGDLYRFHELPREKRNSYLYDKYWFNYFDYIKAWEGVLYYDNRQRKHSWFIQFREFDTTNIPQWFVHWFFKFGLNSIILPDKVRKFYEEFYNLNPSMTYREINFAALYQVPWILKWTLNVANLPLEKFGNLQNRIPYLGRKIYIKWWDKFDFFGEHSIFSTQGIFNYEPPKMYQEIPPESSKNESISDLISKMLEKTSRAELRKQLKALMTDSEDEEDIESHQSDDFMKTQ